MSHNSITIKGENHTSRKDLEEERQLILDDYDAIILEGARSDPEYRAWEGWFHLLLLLFDMTVGHLYQDKSILIDLAEDTGTEVYFTRESDTDLLRNTPMLVHLFGAGSFYGLVVFSLYKGVLDGLFIGSLWLLFAIVFPLITIRFYNMKIRRGSSNRDEIIAQQISDAVENHSRVLAIMGDAHTNGVISRLPDEFEIEYHESNTDLLSYESLREIARPTFTMLSEIYFIFFIIFHLFTYLITIL